MNIFIVRHGQSRQNAQNYSELPYRSVVDPYEQKDSSLSPLGELQADLCGQRLAQVEFDHILCSPLHRTIATAAAIAKYQKNKTIQLMIDLLEASNEDWTGIPLEILAPIYKDVTILPLQDPNPTGGKLIYNKEDMNDNSKLRLRARLLSNYIKETFEENDNILLVTSADFGARIFIPEFLCLPEDIIASTINCGFGISNASISKILYKKERNLPRLIFLNDNLHNDMGHGAIPLR